MLGRHTKNGQPLRPKGNDTRPEVIEAHGRRSPVTVLANGVAHDHYREPLSNITPCEGAIGKRARGAIFQAGAAWAPADVCGLVCYRNLTEQRCLEACHCVGQSFVVGFIAIQPGTSEFASFDRDVSGAGLPRHSRASCADFRRTSNRGSGRADRQRPGCSRGTGPPDHTLPARDGARC